MTDTRLEHSLDNDAMALPKVSVIVVNFNLGRFLREAVESVMRQTYQSVECVIVDDASTDGSQDVIADLVDRFPNLLVRLRERNGGSLAASLEGLAATTGQFVHFLDADDFILETFLEAHVAAHLSVRFPVGFSCCDMLQSFAGQIVACGDANVSRYLCERQRDPAPRRALPPSIAGVLGQQAVPALYLVHPWQIGWPWTATSAIVYRRSALDLFADVEMTGPRQSCTDMFFMVGIHSITGSIILDAPLAVYRHHGSNMHFKRAPLHHVLSFDRVDWKKRHMPAIEALLAHVTANARRFDGVFWHRQSYYHLLKRLGAHHPRGRISPRVLLWRHRRSLLPVFGSRLLLAWFFGRGTTFDDP